MLTIAADCDRFAARATRVHILAESEAKMRATPTQEVEGPCGGTNSVACNETSQSPTGS
jgi:hypothetical protein